ncbi:hypothetical protein EJ03DRAFT_190907 [Teratosphaeria nubilosa]|uniref:Uncharacterized protein n=1 Tax=Teratosphaeria nubilosa TaxID=161662 RepID=A0A6G1LJC9_9PEZI|nr:hypothetical protein EJ03DRAFT_190907 [Teratosphaeria nubilosa]
MQSHCHRRYAFAICRSCSTASVWTMGNVLKRGHTFFWQERPTVAESWGTQTLLSFISRLDKLDLNSQESCAPVSGLSFVRSHSPTPRSLMPFHEPTISWQKNIHATCGFRSEHDLCLTVVPPLKVACLPTVGPSCRRAWLTCLTTHVYYTLIMA